MAWIFILKITIYLNDYTYDYINSEIQIDCGKDIAIMDAT